MHHMDNNEMFWAAWHARPDGLYFSGLGPVGLGSFISSKYLSDKDHVEKHTKEIKYQGQMASRGNNFVLLKATFNIR